MYSTYRQMFTVIAHRVVKFYPCVSNVNHSAWMSYSAHGGIETSKHMQKLLTKKGSKTRRKWYQPHLAEPMELSGRQQRPGKKGISESQGHRSRQLSHVLYTRICQIVNTGELSEDLLEKQVLITQVKMHPTFSGINVYWDACRTDAAEIQDLLDSLSGRLRSLLISYHILGRIPNITFVKDKSKGDMTSLNQLFEIADYGPDYVPRGPLDIVDPLQLTNADPMKSQTAGKETDPSVDEEEATARLRQQLSMIKMMNETDTMQSAGLASEELNERPTNSLNGDFSSAEAGWQDNSQCSNFEQVENRTCEGITSSTINSNSDLKQSPEITYSSKQINFRSDLYALPRDVLMRKIMAKKQMVKNQDLNNQKQKFDLANAPSASQIRDYGKLKSKTQEKLMQQRDSTKEKQRLLEHEFDEVREALTGRDNW